jgi:predicted Zn-dependent protease
LSVVEPAEVHALTDSAAPLTGRATKKICLHRRLPMIRQLAIVALVASLAACATNPVSGNRELALISESQEIAMGRQSAEAAQAQLGLVDDAGLQAYVGRLGTRLAKASERPDLPWTFRVVDDPTPNAFAAPGGYIFATRGLLAMMRNEAELVSVLGHEIGHVTARHSVTMMSRAQIAQIGLGLGSMISPAIAQWGELAAGGMQLMFLKYGRDAERQADDLGYDYALAQGFDVRQMVNVFASLEQSSSLAGQTPVPTWLASHPYPAERIALIRKRLAKLPDSPTLRIGEDEYLAQIDGMAYGVNPRQGYFESNRFFHPQMQFRMNMPKGWRTQNLSQAVAAGSPGKDALIQLTLARGQRKQAADAFFGLQGVTPGRVSRETINGLPAIVGSFQAQTEQGQLGGIAAFVTLADHTYQILAFTPAAKLRDHEQAFRGSIGSFARLTDKAALARQPNRLAIIRLPRAMSLAAFNRAHPSVIPIEELAIINQLEGGASMMPANFRAKRVIGR